MEQNFLFWDRYGWKFRCFKSPWEIDSPHPCSHHTYGCNNIGNGRKEYENRSGSPRRFYRLSMDLWSLLSSAKSVYYLSVYLTSGLVDDSDEAGSLSIWVISKPLSTSASNQVFTYRHIWYRFWFNIYRNISTRVNTAKDGLLPSRQRPASQSQNLGWQGYPHLPV